MKILRLPEVLELTGLSRSTVYELCSQGDFPPSVQLTERTVGWLLDEVTQWIEKRVRYSRSR